MEINRRIQTILKDNNINIQSGTLVLLGIYYGLNVDEVCPEEVVKAINITKIVEKDYRTGALKWNVSLFAGQELEWDWVINKYNDMWSRAPDRKDSSGDVIKRMQKFFSMYPQYRKEDVKNATIAYHRSQGNPQYLKSSAKFIFEGIGAMQKSMLLTWCEKVTKDESDDYQVGKIVK